MPSDIATKNQAWRPSAAYARQSFSIRRDCDGSGGGGCGSTVPGRSSAPAVVAGARDGLGWSERSRLGPGWRLVG
jgi:hypothetical protein